MPPAVWEQTAVEDRQPKYLACSNLEGLFFTFNATRVLVSSSQGQKSRSPGPLMLTHMVHHISRTARPTNFKLGKRMEDDDPHQPQAPRPPRSKIKIARSRDQYGVSVSLEAGGGMPCRPNPAATLRVYNVVAEDN